MSVILIDQNDKYRYLEFIVADNGCGLEVNSPDYNDFIVNLDIIDAIELRRLLKVLISGEINSFTYVDTSESYSLEFSNNNCGPLTVTAKDIDDDQPYTVNVKDTLKYRALDGIVYFINRFT